MFEILAAEVYMVKFGAWETLYLKYPFKILFL